MENNPDYASLLRQLGQMNSEDILRAVVEAKTGRKDFCDQLPVEVDAMAASALKRFVAALEKYQADKVIGDSIK